MMFTKDMPKASILIVNYKTLTYTRNCLESVRRHTENVPYEIIVVDNDSADESLAYLRSQEDIRLIERTTGVVYGPLDHSTALDIGVAASRGEYVVILDSDTLILRDGWLSDLLAIMRQEGAVLAGTCFYRRFIHPCFMVLRRSVIECYLLSFKPFRHFHYYSDTGEQITRVLVRHGEKILNLSYTVAGQPMSHFDLEMIVHHGAVIGGIVYHAFYGTRMLNSDCDGYLSVVKERTLNPAILPGEASRPIPYRLFRDERVFARRLVDDLLFALRAGHYLTLRILFFLYQLLRGQLGSNRVS